MPILELTVEGRYLGQKIINRWNYVSSTTAGSVSLSYALIKALGFLDPPPLPEAGTDFWSRMRQLTNPSFTYTVVTARDLYSDTDFYGYGLGGAPGVNAGDASAAFLAYGFRTTQVKKSVRRGQKRIAGVIDNDMENGGTLTAGGAGKVVNFAIEQSEIQEYVDGGTVVSFTPAILGREAYTTTSGKRAYRYYATETEQLAHTAQGIEFRGIPEITSQVTRKIGRGV